jgi:hypothetical protein
MAVIGPEGGGNGTHTSDREVPAGDRERDDPRVRRVERGRHARRHRAQLAAARDGPDAIRAQYARWFADPARFDELHHYPVSGGASDVIEYTPSWSENGVPHAAHHRHLLTVRDGLIAADTVFCGGRWPASLLADMEAAGD